jgi:hypothetical protein
VSVTAAPVTDASVPANSEMVIVVPSVCPYRGCEPRNRFVFPECDEIRHLADQIRC